MTCVIGLVEPKHIYLGADSLGASQEMQLTAVEPKIVKKRGFAFGHAGSFRFGHILEHALVLPRHPKGMGLHQYMCTKFVERLAETLHDHDGEPFPALIAYKRKLWYLESNYQVLEIKDYMAIGCGKLPALGSLYSTQGQQAKERIRIALEASALWVPGIREPFNIIRV